MASYNRVMLMGNVTRDIELRYLPDGTAVTDMGMALNESYKDASGNQVDSVVFVDVTLWKRTAEIAAEYLRKGSPVFIEGRLKLDTWEQEGQKRSKLKVVGTRLQLIGSKPQQDSQPPTPPQQQSPPPQQPAQQPHWEEENTPF